MNYDIEDLLEYDVDSPEWLQVVNGKRPWTDLFNKNNVKRFLEEMNRKYCEDNNLCEICRSKLVEIKEDRGEFWGQPVKEELWICPKGD